VDCVISVCHDVYLQLLLANFIGLYVHDDVYDWYSCYFIGFKITQVLFSDDFVWLRLFRVVVSYYS